MGHEVLGQRLEGTLGVLGPHESFWSEETVEQSSTEVWDSVLDFRYEIAVHSWKAGDLEGGSHRNAGQGESIKGPAGGASRFIPGKKEPLKNSDWDSDIHSEKADVTNTRDVCGH